MDRFKQDDLRFLIENQEAQPCISIYMPTHRAGAEVQQNPVRFKNLLKEAEERLNDFGFGAGDARDLLGQAQTRLRLGERFWQHQSDGLAVFISPELFQYYRLPVEFGEMVTVGEHFYHRPLFTLFQNEGRFYILALSQDEVRLFQGSKYRVEQVTLEDMPTSLAEALKWDDPEKQLQHREVGPGGGAQGRPAVSFHGHGTGKDDYKTNILRYFHKVDEGLGDYFSEEQAPLVLAGVEYLFPIYAEANSYPHLVENQGIGGNPEELDAATLHARAWDILGPQFESEKEDAIALYRRLAGMNTGRSSEDLGDILRAAYGGLIGDLFIPQAGEAWGRYDQNENRVHLHPERRPESEDLINTAAQYTFSNGGTVHVFPEDRLPGGGQMAAILRY